MQAAVRNANLNSLDKTSDHLSSLEVQLKELWSQYVRRLDENGFDETARSLKDKYYSIYRSYRNNKKWRESMNY